jgi:hypothetical protein
LIGLSAAAVTALVAITYFSIPRVLPGKAENTSQNIIHDSTIIKSSKVKIADIRPTENRILQVNKKRENLITRSQKTEPGVITPYILTSVQKDSLSVSAEVPPTQVNKISVPRVLSLKGEALPNTLVASNFSIIISEYDDGRSKLSRFIAKTFREKILKETKAKDTPLKAYEIAEAGVSGLNKLLGWEMALDKKNDENGELKSVYFSSKILKFNAPVKKTEPLP